MIRWVGEFYLTLYRWINRIIVVTCFTEVQISAVKPCFWLKMDINKD